MRQLLRFLLLLPALRMSLPAQVQINLQGQLNTMNTYAFGTAFGRALRADLERGQNFDQRYPPIVVPPLQEKPVFARWSTALGAPAALVEEQYQIFLELLRHDPQLLGGLPLNHLAASEAFRYVSAYEFDRKLGRLPQARIQEMYRVFRWAESNSPKLRTMPAEELLALHEYFLAGGTFFRVGPPPKDMEAAIRVAKTILGSMITPQGQTPQTAAAGRPVLDDGGFRERPDTGWRHFAFVPNEHFEYELESRIPNHNPTTGKMLVLALGPNRILVNAFLGRESWDQELTLPAAGAASQITNPLGDRLEKTVFRAMPYLTQRSLTEREVWSGQEGPLEVGIAKSSYCNQAGREGQGFGVSPKVSPSPKFDPNMRFFSVSACVDEDLPLPLKVSILDERGSFGATLVKRIAASRP